MLSFIAIDVNFLVMGSSAVFLAVYQITPYSSVRQNQDNSPPCSCRRLDVSLSRHCSRKVTNFGTFFARRLY